MEGVVVSIIVPVYNVMLYLQECIDSVIMQDYKHWELLLVDDGSTDASGELCDKKSMIDERITVYHKVNGGLSSARNYGLNKATGKYVIFLDSDDYWLTTDCLKKLVETAESFEADVVRGEYKEVDENGEDLLIKDFTRKNSKKMQVLTSAVFYRDIVAGENFSVLFLFNKAIFGSAMRFDENRCFQEDIELNIRLFCTDLRCVYIPSVFYAYRKRRNSIVTTSNVNHLRDSFLLSDVFEAYSHKTTDPLLARVYRKNAVMMYYWTLATMAEDPYYQDRDKIISQLELFQRRKRILSWSHKYKVFTKAYIINILSPYLAVLLFRLRNKYM